MYYFWQSHLWHLTDVTLLSVDIILAFKSITLELTDLCSIELAFIVFAKVKFTFVAFIVKFVFMTFKVTLAFKVRGIHGIQTQ